MARLMRLGNVRSRPCAVTLDHVETVPKDRLSGTVTALDRATMREVARALAFALDLGR